MRKSTVAKQVQYFYDFLNLEVIERQTCGNSYKVIQNWYKISLALYKLNEYSFIGRSIQNIFDLGASYQSSSKTISILDADYSKFLTKFNIVKAKCQAIIDFYELQDDLNNLYIKLPDKLNDLIKLSSIIKDLDLSFNKCPILSDNIGRITFNKVEEGSNWIVVTIGAVVSGAVASSKALNWIANFIKSCNEIRIQNRTIKSLDLDNLLKEMEINEKEQQKYKEKIQKAEEDKIKKTCLEKFQQIGFENREISPEDEARIVHCMKTLIDILEEGVELYPSISANDDVKKLFPKQEELKVLEDSQKLLGNTVVKNEKD